MSYCCSKISKHEIVSIVSKEHIDGSDSNFKYGLEQILIGPYSLDLPIAH